MIQIVVFSFDRALQLQTLLNSIIQKWKEPEYKVDVLYNTSCGKFEDSYQSLAASYSTRGNIVFNREEKARNRFYAEELLDYHNIKRYISSRKYRHHGSDFRDRLIRMLEADNSELVLFLTDDSVFYRSVEIPQDWCNWILSAPEDRQISLRVGSSFKLFPDCISESGNMLEWRFSNADFDTHWGYNFSVDAHLYSKRRIVRLLRRNVFYNPNTLEREIAHYCHRRHIFDNGRAWAESRIVSFPINLVQSEFSNEALSVDCSFLDRKFREGWKLEYEIPDPVENFHNLPDYILFRKEEVVERVKVGK